MKPRGMFVPSMLALQAVCIASVMLASGCGLAASRRDQLDLNSASEQQLATVTGLSEDDVNRIVINRPYYHRRDLVDRRILNDAQYEQVRDRFYLGPPAVPSYLRWVAPIP